MAFCVARVDVWDAEADDAVVSKDINDPSEIKELINMSYSYKKDPETKRQVATSYKYSVKLARDGCELSGEYESPTDIKVSAAIKKPCSLGIFAKLVYKRVTGDMHVKRLRVVVGANCYGAQLTDEAFAEQLARVFAMFSHVGDIAPVVVGDKLNPTYRIFKKSPLPARTGTMRDYDDYKEAVSRQLTEFNIVAKLKTELGL